MEVRSPSDPWRLPHAQQLTHLTTTDIEDILETIAFLHGKKWTSMLIKRVYFGNWLRDYSQAVDLGSLKSVNAATIRILVSHYSSVSTNIEI